MQTVGTLYRIAFALHTSVVIISPQPLQAACCVAKAQGIIDSFTPVMAQLNDCRMHYTMMRLVFLSCSQQHHVLCDTEALLATWEGVMQHIKWISDPQTLGHLTYTVMIRIITSCVLLLSCSLSKSDDEGEEDKVYKLIRDLIQFSRPGKESSVS